MPDNFRVLGEPEAYGMKLIRGLSVGTIEYRGTPTGALDEIICRNRFALK